MADPVSRTVALTPERLLRWSVVSGALVLGAGYLVEIPNFLASKSRPLKGWTKFFDLDVEQGTSAWYGSLLLFIVGVLMLWTAAMERRQGRRTALGWTILGAGFLYLSLDEMGSIHEHSADWLRGIPNVLGLFTNHWVIVGGVAAIIAGLAFIPFLLRLPSKSALRLLLAGVVYVGGAVGMEMVDGAIRKAEGYSHSYIIAMLLEETGEVAGTILALRAVALHLTDELGGAGVVLMRRR